MPRNREYAPVACPVFRPGNPRPNPAQPRPGHRGADIVAAILTKTGVSPCETGRMRPGSAPGSVSVACYGTAFRPAKQREAGSRGFPSKISRPSVHCPYIVRAHPIFSFSEHPVRGCSARQAVCGPRWRGLVAGVALGLAVWLPGFRFGLPFWRFRVLG